MKRLIVIAVFCVAAASAATKSQERGFGIGTHDSHPEVVSVGHGGHGGGGGSGWGGWQAQSHGGKGKHTKNFIVTLQSNQPTANKFIKNNVYYLLDSTNIFFLW